MSETAKIKNLWGDLPLQENIRTPYVILKEQGSILTEATDGLLIGEVKNIGNYKNHLECHLIIKAPSINNYTVNIVNLSYPETMYPLEIRSSFLSGFSSKCNNEEELENALNQILSSAEVRRIISGLLSEIRADAEK